jgi:hypothetical protein
MSVEIKVEATLVTCEVWTIFKLLGQSTKSEYKDKGLSDDEISVLNDLYDEIDTALRPVIGLIE